MACKFIISDPSKGTKTRVTDEGALVVTTVPASAQLLAEIEAAQGAATGGTSIPQYYRDQLSLNGDGVTFDMSVDGSVTPQKFSITAAVDADIVITQVVVILADNTVALNKFGQLAALTNGWDLTTIQNGTTTFVIEKAKTGGRILVQSGMNESFGSGGDVNEITAFTGNSDALSITIPMDRYIPGGGLRIPAGSTDKLEAVVNDNLTSLDEFTVTVIGHKNFI